MHLGTFAKERAMYFRSTEARANCDVLDCIALTAAVLVQVANLANAEHAGRQ
jgi:hypothetical protein